MNESVMLTAVILLASAAGYARMGDHAAARARVASRAGFFAVWWIGVSVALVIQGIAAFVFAFGLSHPLLWAGFVLVTILALTIATWGLMTTLVYLLTGREHVIAIGAYHAGVFSLFAGAFATMRPLVVVEASWGSRLVYDHIHPGMAWSLAALFLPPLIASALALATARRVTDRGARRRYIAAAASVFLFIAAALLYGVVARTGPGWSAAVLVAALVTALTFGRPSNEGASVDRVALSE